MARLARLALPGYPHLVSHRAGARDLIVDDEDARRLLQELRQALLDADVALHGYTLLPRGLWLLATPVDAGGLGRAMQSIGRRFVRWVNDRRGEQGGIFCRALSRCGDRARGRKPACTGVSWKRCRCEPSRARRSTSIPGQAVASIWDWRPIRSCGRCRPTGRWETRRSTARPHTGGCSTPALARMRRPASPRPFPVDGSWGRRPSSARSRHSAPGARNPLAPGALAAAPASAARLRAQKNDRSSLGADHLWRVPSSARTPDVSARKRTSLFLHVVVSLFSRRAVRCRVSNKGQTPID